MYDLKQLLCVTLFGAQLPPDEIIDEVLFFWGDSQDL